MIQASMIQPQIYFCRKCYAETQTINPECPQCGKTMQTQSTIKSLGKVIIILGIVIALFGGLGVLVALVVIAVLLFGKTSEKGMTTDAFILLTGCGAVMLTGITAIIRGARQAKHGRTSNA